MLVDGCIPVYMLGYCSCFLLSADFFQNHLFRKILSGMPSHFVGPDLGPNCLQRLSADNTRGFVWFDSLRPIQQFFSHVRIGLPGLIKFLAQGHNTVPLVTLQDKGVVFGKLNFLERAPKHEL